MAEYDNEIWVPVTGYESEYEVSSSGKLRRNGREIATGIDRYGYIKAVLRSGSDRKNVTMHRVVALAFLGTPFCEAMVVNHKDCNKANNDVTNLEWVTQSENVKHAVRAGRFGSKGSGHHLAVLNESAIPAIRAARKIGISLKELAIDYGVSLSTISAAATGRTWKEVNHG